MQQSMPFALAGSQRFGKRKLTPRGISAHPRLWNVGNGGTAIAVVLQSDQLSRTPHSCAHHNSIISSLQHGSWHGWHRCECPTELTKPCNSRCFVSVKSKRAAMQLLHASIWSKLQNAFAKMYWFQCTFKLMRVSTHEQRIVEGTVAMVKRGA